MALGFYRGEKTGLLKGNLLIKGTTIDVDLSLCNHDFSTSNCKNYNKKLTGKVSWHLTNEWTQEGTGTFMESISYPGYEMGSTYRHGSNGGKMVSADVTFDLQIDGEPLPKFCSMSCKLSKT
jgi:hypothetical protein